MKAYFLLATGWILWCFLHSYLIRQRTTHFIHSTWPGMVKYYRLVYNLIAALTLIPVIMFGRKISSPVLFDWSGSWKIAQVALLILVVVIGYLGAREYNIMQFLGIRQIQEGTAKGSLNGENSITTHGILGYMRHPWYTAALLVIWARPIDIATLLVNAILSMYLIVGAFIEERKLLAAYGAPYKAYQEKVPMFIPSPKIILARWKKNH